MEFNIEQIRKYIISQDSLGDVLYNLSDESILEANVESDEIQDEYDDRNNIKFYNKNL